MQVYEEILHREPIDAGSYEVRHRLDVELVAYRDGCA